MSNAVSVARAQLSIDPAIRSIDPFRVHPLPVRASVPEHVQPWLRLRRSMTREIAQYHDSAPKISPAYEGPGRLAPWESLLIGAPKKRAYIREVTLSVTGEPVIQARTLSLFADPAEGILRLLNDRPLAEVLFRDHRWQRISPPIPLLDLKHRRVGRACLWQFGVRSPSRILVTEYFLDRLFSRRH